MAADPTATSIDIRGEHYGVYTKWILPDCFFEHPPTFNSIYIANVAFVSNFSRGDEDPWNRLSRVLSNVPNTLGNFQFHSVSFRDEFENLVPMNWTGLTAHNQIWFDSLHFYDSLISGALPQDFGPRFAAIGIGSANFGGTIPSTIFAGATLNSPLGKLPSLFIDSSANMTGTIPPNLFSSSPNLIEAVRGSTNIRLVLTDFPGLTGTVPPDLWGIARSSSVLSNLAISFAGTSLGGTIPKSFMANYSFPSMTELSLSLARTKVTGDFPIYDIKTSPNAHISLRFTNTALNGTVPTATFRNLAANAANDDIYSSVYFDNCNLTGILSLPPPRNTSQTEFQKISVYASDNRFVYFSAKPNSAKYLYRTHFSNNAEMQGTLGDIGVRGIEGAIEFANTQLSGILPNMSEILPEVMVINLDGTNIEFCDGVENRGAWSPYAVSCSLQRTSAHNCPDRYPTCATDEAPPPPTPTQTSSNHTLSTCPESSRPSPEFTECVYSSWVAPHGVNSSVLNIPMPNSTSSNQIYIIGDVSSSVILYNGLDTTVTVDGCISNLKQINVSLSPRDVQFIGNKVYRQTLLNVEPEYGNCTDLSKIALQASLPKSSSKCSRLSSRIEPQEGQFVGVFSVSDDGCKSRWWIILVAVLVPVVILAVIVTVVVVSCCNCAKLKVRPYAGSEPTIF